MEADDERVVQDVLAVNGQSSAPLDNGAVEDKRRERSTVEFPYGDLDDALALAMAVYQNGGGECTLDQLAFWMNHESVRSGTFRMKLATARTFGVIAVDGERVTLTPLGRQIVDPQQQHRARVDAFLRVPLYSRIYERFKGSPLPPGPGLEQAMVNFGVAFKQKDKARQAFQRSAEQARVLSPSRDRLVLPGGIPNGGAVPILDKNESVTGHDTPKRDIPKQSTSEQATGMSAHDGSENQWPGHHKLIQGLFETLPRPGASWADQDRDAWVALAKSIFNVVYVAEND